MMTSKQAMRVKAWSRRTFLKWMGKAASLLSVASIAGIGWFKPSQVIGASEKPTVDASSPVSTNESDLVLKNGLVVDGTGQKGFLGDVIVRGDKILDISKTPITTQTQVLDCSGKVIAPGFIDMHSHMDWIMPIENHPKLHTPFTAQGITTFVTGNCGFGVAGFKKDTPYRSMLETRTKGLYHLQWDTMADYFHHIESKGISHNILNLAGHGTTRTSLTGFDETPIQGEQLKEMIYLLEEALEQGSQGVSLGLQYEPGVFAKKEELKAVADLVKKKDKILTVHMKAYSSLSGTYPLEFFGTPHNLLGIQEMLELARETGVKMQLSHLIFVGERTWKSYQKALEMIEQARSEGLDIMFDTYAYHCGTSIINVILPEWFLAGIPEVYKSRTSLLKLRAELTLIKTLLGFGYEDIQITKANHPDLEQFNGMFLQDIANKRNKGEFENFVDFARLSQGKAKVLNHRYSNQEQVKAMLQHPASLLQTDATMALEGTQNPACFGNFPRFLQCAREYKLLTLEEVVQKMTAAAADRFGIKDRGRLEKGKAADISVFDWNKVKDNNTDESTDRAPTGIETVLINGEIVKQNNEVDGAKLAGAVLS